MSYDVTCIIPRWGRTFTNAMEKFATLANEKEQINAVVKIVAQGKDLASADPGVVKAKLDEFQSPYVSIAPDRKRTDRCYRIGFLGMDLTIGEIVLRVEGDEPHNGSSLIKLDEVDMTIVGLDELLALNQLYLHEPEKVTKWGLYNYNLVKGAELRIAGSANLMAPNKVVGKKITDFVGFFLITNRQQPDPTLNFEKLLKNQNPVYVKGRYRELVQKLLPGLNSIPVENVEDAVVATKGSAGIEIIQTGSTIKSKGLQVYGAPLFLSESLYVADYHRYMQNPKLQQLLEILNPLGYFEPERIDHYVDWYAALEINLGDAWINKPKPGTLFCSFADMENGLRPYRLQTRKWAPSDQYKIAEAEILVRDSLRQIEEAYEKKRPILP
ncbi:MAG TPA: hypothetical protein VHY08_24680 [Bacillota bacterium]|nr:hypothetical protein [Bacillota bacterium]